MPAAGHALTGNEGGLHACFSPSLVSNLHGGDGSSFSLSLDFKDAVIRVDAVSVDIGDDELIAVAPFRERLDDGKLEVRRDRESRILTQILPFLVNGGVHMNFDIRSSMEAFFNESLASRAEPTSKPQVLPRSMPTGLPRIPKRTPTSPPIAVSSLVSEPVSKPFSMRSTPLSFLSSAAEDRYELSSPGF